MRNFVTLLLIISLTSCVSFPYLKEKDKDNFSEIKAGNTYTFLYQKDLKQRFEVTSIENDSIRGTYQKKNYAIAKKDITEIRKANTGATVGLVGGIVGVAIVSGVILTNIVKETAGIVIAGK